VERMRRDIPNLTLRTAFIVGHPGETDEDFEELCDVVRWARFERLAAFCYSDEEDTVSHSQGSKVPAKVARTRYRKLMSMQKKISLQNHRALVGRTMDVLVEGPSEEHAFVLVGRHAGQAPEIDGQVFLSNGEATPGTMRRVRVSQASHYDLVGELVDLEPDASSIVLAADEGAPAAYPSTKRRVALRVVPGY
jgi:ribosomal protein S12 methylthiotransferase